MSMEFASMALKAKYLNSKEKLLMIVVADACDSAGYTLRGTVNLRKDCGWKSPNTFTRHMKVLKLAGLIKAMPRATTLYGRQTNLTHIVKVKLELLASKYDDGSELHGQQIQLKNDLIEARIKAKSFKTIKSVVFDEIRGLQGVTTKSVVRNKINDLAPITTFFGGKLGELSQAKNISKEKLTHPPKQDFDVESESATISKELDDQNITLPSGLVVGGEF